MPSKDFKPIFSCHQVLNNKLYTTGNALCPILLGAIHNGRFYNNS